MGHSHRLHCQKGPPEAVLPSPAEEVKPATGAAETVLLSHHRECPLHFNNCLVQLSYQIWPQKTMEGSPDCWANHWYNPPYSPRTALIQSEQKSWQNHSGPFTSSTLPLWTVTVWSTLQSSEHQNDQTQEQFLPSGNPWQTLDIKRGTHTIYTHTTFQMCTYLYIQLSICLLLFLIHLLYFYYFIICVFCPVTVILLHCGSFCH